MTWILDLLLPFHVSLRYCSFWGVRERRRCSFFSSLLFPCCSDEISYIVLSSSSLFLSYVPSFLMVSHPLSFLFQFFYFLVLEFPFGYSYNFSFFIETFWVFFPHMFRVLIILHWSFFITASLKSLSDISNSVVMIVLAYVDCLFSLSLRSSWFWYD